MQTAAPLPADGRAARAARTREAIVDASVALIEEGDIRPTAPRIAERAGVSVRSVFQHFDDLPSLYTAVVERVVERLAVLVVSVDPALALEDRIAAFAAHRGALLEAVTPFRRAAAVHAPFAPMLDVAVAQGSAFLRQQVEAAFAPELAGDPELAEAVAAAASWGLWNALRAEAGRSPEAAQAVVRRILGSLLAGS
ncbi:MAG TPA: TetR/AcrR family transcriptional regulator [Acidimicrobiales bacterium]|nr:TetR/AcrR family transcriptional regulator [Acidimicrobiales bacterium]